MIGVHPIEDLHRFSKLVSKRRHGMDEPISSVWLLDGLGPWMDGPRRQIVQEQETLERARRDQQEGKAPSTQAGEFIREEMHHIREGKHGTRSAKQAIAIGLSKARRAGVKLRPPAKGRVSEKTRRSAASAYRKGQRGTPTSPKRSQARSKVLRREGRTAASHRALSRQARTAARRRSAANRSAAAKKAARTRWG